LANARGGLLSPDQIGKEESAEKRSGKKHRIEGQHLCTDCDHQRDTLESMTHIEIPSNI